MSFIKTMMAPFNRATNFLGSFFSEQGKMSMKRGISWFFAMAILYVIWFFLNKTVPLANQPALLHMFDGLCIMIALLTGVATVKDIITIWKGGPAQPDSTTPQNNSSPTSNTNQP